MSEIGHTPGPWGVHPFARHLFCVGPVRNGIYQCSIAELRFNWTPDDFRADAVARKEEWKEIQAANARLIAAAPDLLSCLLAYVEIEEEAAPCSSSPLRERARAAIAKAVGQ